MEKVQTKFGVYARIKGISEVVKLAEPNQKMSLNQAINAKSWQRGATTKYAKVYANGVIGPVHVRCFISLCEVRNDRLKQAPNHQGYLVPQNY